MPKATTRSARVLPERRGVNETLRFSDIQAVTAENSINVTKICTDEKRTKICEKIDRETYSRVKVADGPWFVPAVLRRREITEIPNSELLISGIVAGSVTEALRTVALYPLDTVKARIQADPKRRRRGGGTTLRRRLWILRLSFMRHYRRGDLYAGLLPIVAVSVPSSGVYFGVRDVAKRVAGAAAAAAPFDVPVVALSLYAALVADVASLAVRTPIDVVALRSQVARSSKGGQRGRD